MAKSAKPGLVIALDGSDGVGKTVQVEKLADYFKRNGRKVHLTRHLGGTPIGEELRKVSLSSVKRPADTDAFISLAIGAALAEDISKRKAVGEVVIIDRSPLSIVAYNGFGSQLKSMKLAFDACEALTRKEMIDHLLFLTAPAKTLESRRQQRGKKDYFENQDKAFHKRVQQGYEAALDYLQKLSNLKTKISTIDASKSIDTVHKSVVKVISS